MDFRAVPLETLREYARERSERASLRQVAAAAGVGRTTLQKFIRGDTSPHPRVKRALSEWYLEEIGREAGASAAEAYDSALDVLVQGFPEMPRRHARAMLLEVVDRSYALLGIPHPPALSALREQGDDEEP